MQQTTHNPKGIDFSKIEVIRRHMGLSPEDMASIFSVSRMTYYNWVVGKSSPASTRVTAIKRKLKQMLGLLTDEKLSTPDYIGLSVVERRKHLVALLSE